MARRIGPDEASREVKAIVGGIFRAKHGRPAQLWADDAATVPADVLFEDGSAIPVEQPANNGGRGSAPTVTIDGSSMLPLIQYPPGDVDFVVVTCDGGTPWRAYARTDDRLDALGAAVASAETPDGAQDKADAAQAAAIAASAQRAANLSDLADASTARTNLGAQSRYVSAAAAANTRGLLMKLRRGVEDARLLVVGDSTGNATDEWVYLLAQHLAQLFPACTVTVRFWDESTETDYQSPVTVQTGTGSRTLSIYNASRSGASTDYLLGTRFANAITAVASPDLVMISHGHNTGGPPSSTAPTDIYIVERLSESVALTHPNAPIVFVAQNPSAVAGRETWQAIKASLMEGIAARRGFGVIDVHQAFVDYGNWQADLTNADGLHPNAGGSALWASVVESAFTDAVNAAPARVLPSPLSLTAPNLITNATFGSWTLTDPDGWTMTLCTPSKDTATFETGADAMKLTASGSGTSYARQTVSLSALPRLKGAWVTLAARVYVPASNTATVRMTLTDSVGGGGAGTNVDVVTGQRDRWQWIWTSRRIEAAATSIDVRLGVRSAGSSAVEATWDRVWLGEGVFPYAAGIY